MRIWTLHPRYLDGKGLVALWREALLAQKVLAGRTQGYRHHPQLLRFREQSDPLAAMASYLRVVHDEAQRRGYHFDRDKIMPRAFDGVIEEHDGQLLYEWQHLKEKLALRDQRRLAELQGIARPDPHPLFRIVPGPRREWEKVQG